MGFIRTLLGDIRPEEMGFTLSHEHLVCRPPYWVWKNDDDLLLDDPEKTLADMMDYKRMGGARSGCRPFEKKWPPCHWNRGL